MTDSILTPSQDAAAPMKRGDWELLERIVASNGGGVHTDLLPKAKVRRLLRAGLVRYKSVNRKQPWGPLNDTAYGRLIHTTEGLALVRACHADTDQTGGK